MNEVRCEEAREAAKAAALTAWEAIRGLYENGSHIEHTAEGPSTEADKLADKIIQRELKKTFAESTFGYLTEETRDDLIRLEREGVWIIDPIDGTSDFILKNGNFAMHLGYAERTPRGLWEVVMGVVYWPEPGRMYSAIKGKGSINEACRENRLTGKVEPLKVSTRREISEMRVVTSNSHRSERQTRMMDELGFAEVMPIGSIGVKMGLIASGDYDVYMNMARGKCREWDICAPDLILTEAGGIFTDLDGGGFTYNKENVRDKAGLLATNGLAHEKIRAKIAEFEAANP